MSKVSFRARALDTTKPMPVFNVDDLPDLSECASINRAVPAMPTGMEKEEEMELHLQQAISAQQAISTGTLADDSVNIPIPKVSILDEIYYDGLYQKRGAMCPAEFKCPKQLIKIQAALNLEPEMPEYDLDYEDEQWIKEQAERMELGYLQFERMMDRLEKASEHQVLNLEEAKSLLQEDDDLSIAVYDYWLNKRLKTKHPLLPQVKTEKRGDPSSASSTNPYFAFRRRAEKIQTRKNRRNDEDSYEKMLKIRRDLSKAVTLLDMVKRREKSKRELINLTMDIFDRRYGLEDFKDDLFNQLKAEVKPSFQFSKDEMLLARRLKQRENRKRKNREGSLGSNGSRKSGRGGGDRNGCLSRELVSHEWLLKNAEEWMKPTSFPGSSIKPPAGFQDLDAASRLLGTSTEAQSWLEDDGPFAFKRHKGCAYFSALADHDYGPTTSTCSTGSASLLVKSPAASPASCSSRGPRSPRLDPHAYVPAYLHNARGNLRFVGPVRRRLGRGGRVIFDRPLSRDPLVPETARTKSIGEPSRSSQQQVTYFRPASPIGNREDARLWRGSTGGQPGTEGLNLDWNALLATVDLKWPDHAPESAASTSSSAPPYAPLGTLSPSTTPLGTSSTVSSPPGGSTSSSSHHHLSGLSVGDSSILQPPAFALVLNTSEETAADGDDANDDSSCSAFASSSSVATGGDLRRRRRSSGRPSVSAPSEEPAKERLSAHLVKLRTGAPACAYGTHQGQIEDWIMQQADELKRIELTGGLTIGGPPTSGGMLRSPSTTTEGSNSPSSGGTQHVNSILAHSAVSAVLTHKQYIDIFGSRLRRCSGNNLCSGPAFDEPQSASSGGGNRYHGNAGSSGSSETGSLQSSVDGTGTSSQPSTSAGTVGLIAPFDGANPLDNRAFVKLDNVYSSGVVAGNQSGISVTALPAATNGVAVVGRNMATSVGNSIIQLPDETVLSTGPAPAILELNHPLPTPSPSPKSPRVILPPNNLNPAHLNPPISLTTSSLVPSLSPLEAQSPLLTNRIVLTPAESWSSGRLRVGGLGGQTQPSQQHLVEASAGASLPVDGTGTALGTTVTVVQPTTVYSGSTVVGGGGNGTSPVIGRLSISALKLKAAQQASHAQTNPRRTPNGDIHGNGDSSNGGGPRLLPQTNNNWSDMGSVT